jgi:hypothetical protein
VRYLDEAGADALVRWFSTHPDLEDSDLVESVLEEIEGEGAWKTRWYSPGRDLTTGGWIIEPRPGAVGCGEGVLRRGPATRVQPDVGWANARRRVAPTGRTESARGHMRWPRRLHPSAAKCGPKLSPIPSRVASREVVFDSSLVRGVVN